MGAPGHVIKCHCSCPCLCEERMAYEKQPSFFICLHKKRPLLRQLLNLELQSVKGRQSHTPERKRENKCFSVLPHLFSPPCFFDFFVPFVSSSFFPGALCDEQLLETPLFFFVFVLWPPCLHAVAAPCSEWCVCVCQFMFFLYFF